MKKIISLFFGFFVIFILLACNGMTSSTNELESEKSKMGFSITLPGNNKSNRAVYYTADDATSYSIIIKQGSITIDSKNANPGDTVKIDISDYGTYTIEVIGYMDSTVIATGSTTSTLSASDGYKQISVSLNPKEKKIGFEITVTWNNPSDLMEENKNFIINNHEYKKTSLINVISEDDEEMTIVGNLSSGPFSTGRTIVLSPYEIGKYEVTQEFYKAVMGTNPSSCTSDISGEDTNLKPVDSATWYQVIAFCNKLSVLCGYEPVYSVSGINDWKNLSYSDVPTNSNSAWQSASIDLTKNGYRLPTEAEWEFAARGGDITADDWNYTYAGSNDYSKVAWASENSSYESHEVGLKHPNKLGLYDMSGNAYEWCSDFYSSLTSSLNTIYNPVVISGSYRVQRSGAWKDSYIDTQLSMRRTDACGGGDSAHWIDWGFRIARNLSSKTADKVTYIGDSNTNSETDNQTGNYGLNISTEKVGYFVYTDKTISSNYDSTKTVAGIICGYNANGEKLVLGLSESSSRIAWATRDSTGNETKFENIISSYTRTNRTSNSNGKYLYENLVIDGDTDGSDNWNEICKVDSNAEQNIENYPIFQFAKNYGSTESFTGYFSSGWFIPSLYELYVIYQNMGIINESLSLCNGDSLQSKRYWTSSEWKYDAARSYDTIYDGSSWNIDFSYGYMNPEWLGKESAYYTRAICILDD